MRGYSFSLTTHLSNCAFLGISCDPTSKRQRPPNKDLGCWWSKTPKGTCFGLKIQNTDSKPKQKKTNKKPNNKANKPGCLAEDFLPWDDPSLPGASVCAPSSGGQGSSGPGHLGEVQVEQVLVCWVVCSFSFCVGLVCFVFLVILRCVEVYWHDRF